MAHLTNELSVIDSDWPKNNAEKKSELFMYITRNLCECSSR